MPEEQKRNAIKEFNFKKGILVATFSGVFSAAFAFGLDSAAPIKESALKNALQCDTLAESDPVAGATPQELKDLDDRETTSGKVHSGVVLRRINGIKESAARDAVIKSFEEYTDPQLRHVILAIA